MFGKLPWIIAVLAVCSPVQAEPPGTLDLIPEDAVAGVALRPLGELKKKADQLAVEAKLKIPPVPSQEIDNLLAFLGVRGGFDFASAAGVVLAHPKYIGSKDPATQELLALTATALSKSLALAHALLIRRACIV